MPSETYRKFRCGIEYLVNEHGASFAELVRAASALGYDTVATYCPSDGPAPTPTPTPPTQPGPAGDETDFTVVRPDGTSVGQFRAPTGTGAIVNALQDLGYQAQAAEDGTILTDAAEATGEWSARSASGLTFARVRLRRAQESPQKATAPTTGSGKAAMPDPEGAATSPARAAIAAYYREEGLDGTLYRDLDDLLDYVLQGNTQLPEILQDIQISVGDSSYAVKHWLAALGALWYGNNAYDRDQTQRLRTATAQVVPKLKDVCCWGQGPKDDVTLAWDQLKTRAESSRYRPAERWGRWIANNLVATQWQLGGALSSWIEVQPADQPGLG